MSLAKKISADIVAAVASLSTERPIPLHEPDLGENEIRSVKEVVSSGYISTVGPAVKEFERLLCEYIGVKHVIAVSSGTAALHASLSILTNPNDEILMPSLSFVATANAARYCGAIPHFVDVDRQTLGICPDSLKSWLRFIGEKTSQGLRNKVSGRRIRMLVPMHTFGQPCEMESLKNICETHHMWLVEDGAESLGTLYKGRHMGTFGDLGCVSFNGNKIITTGGGGAITTNNDTLANKVRHVVNTAKIPHPWEYLHDNVGFNYRMPALNAALGCGQLERIEELVERKRQVFRHYQEHFRDSKEVKLYSEIEGARSNYWLNIIMLNLPSSKIIEDVLTETHQSSLYCRPCWKLLHTLPMYTNSPASPLLVSQELAQKIINLPSSAKLWQKTS